MRTRRLLAALGAPLLVVACATSTAPVIGAGDAGAGGSGADSGDYGADAGGSDGGSSNSEGGATKIDSGTTGGSDSGGGGGGRITAGGDCIGDPQAPLGYDFACDLAESFGGDSPCTSGMNQCAADECCFVDPSAMCYSDYPDISTQCVPYGG